MTTFNNKLYVVVRGSDDRIYYRAMDTSGVWELERDVAGGDDDKAGRGGVQWEAPPGSEELYRHKHLVEQHGYGRGVGGLGTALWVDAGPGGDGGVQQPAVHVREGDGRQHYYRYLNTTGTWGDWTAMYGKTTISPTIAAFNGRLYLIVKSSIDNTIWMRSMDAEETWGNWSIMPGLTAIPVAVAIY